MTTDLEKQFFDVFEIEPRKVKICRNINHCPKKYKLCNDDCKHWQVVRTDYPQITDRILLELICIVLNTFQTFEVYRIMDIDSLKEKILKLSMLAKDDVYSQVQELFKECE